MSLSEIIIFFLPAIITNLFFNTFYEVKRKLGWLSYDYPLDFNLRFLGNRLLGESTTLGGLVIAILSGLVLSLIPYFSNTMALALLAYFGHALGSFIKRRMGFPRGKFMPIIDHGDYMILTSFFFIVKGIIDFKSALIGILIVLIFQPTIGYLAWKFNWRDNKI